MKLIFDCRFIRIENHDGISRFSTELFNALSKKIPVTALISDAGQLKELPEDTEFILANQPTDGLRELFLPLKLNRHSPTHVFSPMQTMGSLGRKYKLILTLHDLIYYSHPKPPTALPWYVKLAWRLYHLSFTAVRILLNNADSVVTVSKTTRELILKHRLTSKPVRVVYNAASTPTKLQDTRVGPKARRQLIYMGSFMPYKNLECLIEGMKQLPEWELVCLSKISQKQRASLITLAGAASPRVVFKNGVTDSEYFEILDGAFALVTASRDEGFGIPLVEAMKRGIPLVVSEIPIFREVAAEAAHFFHPDRPDEFAAAVLELENPTSWTLASEASINRVKLFNWSDSASALLEAIEQS